MYQDRTLNCGDCRNSFTFTAGEQEFHASKGFNNDPSRCPDCRSARKARNGGSSDFSSARGGGGYERQMHPATCAECGTATEVPFVPSGARPVYCRDCYSRQTGGSRSGGGRSFGGGRSNRY